MTLRPSETRHITMLETAFGPTICEARQTPDVTEIIVNPDGSIWLEQAGQRNRQSTRLAPKQAEQIIRLVASHSKKSCTPSNPILSAELPGGGERFEGLLPPDASAACFVIRKPATRVFTLDDYVGNDTLTPIQKMLLEEAVTSRSNIVVAGGTASGKTTLVNALLSEVSATGDRVVLIEDTVELQCTAEDHAALRTVQSAVSMRDLVRSSLRLRPDRIIIGEVRGGEALDLLKAWNTGHPGGITTIHANSATAVLARLEQLALEASRSAPRALIAEAIDLIVFIQKTSRGRKVTELLRVTGLDDYGDYQTEVAAAPAFTLVQPEEILS